MQLRDYHGNDKTANFFGEGNKFIGFELEVDNRNGTKFTRGHIVSIIDKKFNYREDGKQVPRLFFERDGSLSSYGFEIISAPHTLEELRSFDLKTLFETIKENDLLGNKSHNSGLHFHFSRTWFENSEHIARVSLILERYYDELLSFTRRSNANAKSWCNRYGITELKEMLSGLRNGGRGYHTNGRGLNNDTVEFRLFKSTLDEDVFRASYEMIVGVIRATRVMKFSNTKELEYSSIVDFLTDRNQCYKQFLKGYDKSKEVIAVGNELSLDMIRILPSGIKLKATVIEDIKSIKRENVIESREPVGINEYMIRRQGMRLDFDTSSKYTVYNPIIGCHFNYEMLRDVMLSEPVSVLD